MARKLIEVYLSSTSLDLAEYRRAIRDELATTGVFLCISTEDFAASNANVEEYLQSRIRAADIFVGLIGMRRGYEPKGNKGRRSITEMEIAWAAEAGLKQYIWVAPDDFAVPGNLRETAVQHKRQLSFRKQIMEGALRTISTRGFESPQRLASTIVTHLLVELLAGNLASALAESNQDPGIIADAREALDQREVPSATQSSGLRDVETVDETTSGASSSTAIQDFRTRIERDPEDPAQLSLGIAVYATALATIFRTATGEFCFGLFGSWGIGKTRLVKSLAPLLESPDLYQLAMSQRGYSVGEHPSDILRYQVVWYSAWKYRRPPEAWVFLYETLARRAMDAGLFVRLGRAIRTGVARHGYWHLILGLITLGIIAVPLNSWLRLGVTVAGIVGIAGLFYLISITRRGEGTLRSLMSRYAVLTRHNERLGLQALIGSDLKALLLGWIPFARSSVPSPGTTAKLESSFAIQPSGYALAVLLLFAGAWLWTLLAAPSLFDGAREAIDRFCGTILDDKGFACRSDTLQGFLLSPYFFVFVGWIIISFVVLWAVRWGGGDVDRVLLVIDRSRSLWANRSY